MTGGDTSDKLARELDRTPTWAVAAVCAVIIIISIALEKILHKLGAVLWISIRPNPPAPTRTIRSTRPSRPQSAVPVPNSIFPVQARPGSGSLSLGIGSVQSPARPARLASSRWSRGGRSSPSTHTSANTNSHVGAQVSLSLASMRTHPLQMDCQINQYLLEKPFGICRNKPGTLKLKSSLLVLNREKRNESKLLKGCQAAKILRPGMVLLKNFISCKDQVEIVQTCQKLGKGNGGFYQPAYWDGATMHLKMMCLGKNWDPETSSYGERRPVDGAEPPPIPSEFHKLVQKAIQDTHVYLLKEVEQKNVENVLPSMTPDICIVNFYTSTGRLDLHKDQDESQESLNRGLPVVSISIGDSAEFLYGDQMDIDKAEKVVLDSGDVLIFGGKSRHVYHGVTCILPRTAPQALLQETDLRPGRLNLTFRKF